MLSRNESELLSNQISKSFREPFPKEKLKIDQEESFFDQTFKSNIKSHSSLCNYEYAFDKLHKQSNLYEVVDELCEYKPSQPKRYKIYNFYNLNKCAIQEK